MNGCERLAGSGDLAWSLRCGGPSRERLLGVSFDAAGNILVGLELRPDDLLAPMGQPFHIGDFEITPGELSDILLVKLDTEGEVLWVKQFTGPGNQYPETIRGCGDGVVITGSAPPGTLDFGGGPIAEENFIASLDGEGEQRWSRGVTTTRSCSACRLAGSWTSAAA